MIKNQKVLSALPTRDALLPFIVLLSEVIKQKQDLSSLVSKVTNRFTASGRLQDVPVEKSKKLISDGISDSTSLLAKIGFGSAIVVNTNVVDGLRLSLDHDVIVHLRPSGNAPELRCYIEASSQKVADKLVKSTLKLVKEACFS